MYDLLLAGRGEILLTDPVSKKVVKFIALKWSDSVHALHS
jgi:hypothetical protein